MNLAWIRRFAILRIVIASACVIVPALALHAAFSLLPLAKPAVAYLSALVGYAGYVRRVEQRALVEFGRIGALRELALGAVLGSALFAACVLSLALAGSYEFRSLGDGSALAGPLVAALMAGVLEELVFRGIVFRIVEQSLGTWLSLAISALLFGAAHLMSPHWTWLGLAAIVLEAGVLLAGAFVLTRRLWLPIGLHIAWNFTEGGIFGLAVSGTATKGLLRGELTGPTWLTGAAYGVEGSAVAVGWCLVAACALFALAARRRNILASAGRRR